MAGSRTFLQPILDATVGGIQTAVNDVVEVVEPIPDKIDDQIESLQDVVDKCADLQSLIGATASSLNVTTGSDSSKVYLNTATIATTTSYTQIATIQCNCSGAITVSANIKTTTSGMHCYVGYKINDGSYSQGGYSTSTNYEKKTFAVTFSKGDIIYIGLKAYSSSIYAYCNNVTISWKLFDPTSDVPFN